MKQAELEGLAILSQFFLGVGLFAIAAYRCYLQTTGVRDLRKEFATYGLPACFVYVVCVVEFGLAMIFTSGIGIRHPVFSCSIKRSPRGDDDSGCSLPVQG